MKNLQGVRSVQLSHPGLRLPCPDCHSPERVKVTGPSNSYLVHDRTNFGKSRTLFPIWTNSGVPIWAVVMFYDCPTCKAKFKANDGRLLHLLPAHVQQKYPVLPKYCSGPFHLSTDLTDDMELSMKTYANAEYVSAGLHRKQATFFTRKVTSFLSMLSGPSSTSYPTFSKWNAGIYPPSAASIRSLYEEAEHSYLTPYGYSNVERYTCEIQGVEVGKSDRVAFDHTFQTLKNYKLPGAKAIFTGNKGSTKEITTLAIVPSTSIKEVSHLLQQMVQNRRHFEPGTVYTDTCPHNKSFWKALLGEATEARLGLFHLMNRIYSTLDPKSGLYWKALVGLKKCIYSYHPDDEAKLITSLKQGTFSRVYTKYTDQEINELRYTKLWKQRFGPYLRKRFFPANVIICNLQQWIVDFQGLSDDLGKGVFTQKTVAVTREQFKKVEHAIEHETEVVYTEIPPGPKSTHGLSKWQSNRPESPLEKFHELLAHFANSGTNCRLADALTLRGTAEWNVVCRWKQHINSLKLKGQESNQPCYLDDKPLFFDHSMLAYLNEVAKGHGLTPIFDFVKTPRPNNGEVFLSDYYHQQQERNKTSTGARDSARCPCSQCKTPSTNLKVPEQSRPTQSRQKSESGTQLVRPNLTTLKAPPAPIPLPFPSQPVAMNIAQTVPITNSGWAWIPSDACSPTPPYYCEEYGAYLVSKKSGKPKRGRPKHSHHCQHWCASALAYQHALSYQHTLAYQQRPQKDIGDITAIL